MSIRLVSLSFVLDTVLFFVFHFCVESVNWTDAQSKNPHQTANSMSGERTPYEIRNDFHATWNINLEVLRNESQSARENTMKLKCYAVYYSFILCFSLSSIRICIAPLLYHTRLTLIFMHFCRTQNHMLFARIETKGVRTNREWIKYRNNNRFYWNRGVWTHLAIRYIYFLERQGGQTWWQRARERES